MKTCKCLLSFAFLFTIFFAGYSDVFSAEQMKSKFASGIFEVHDNYAVKHCKVFLASIPYDICMKQMKGVCNEGEPCEVEYKPDDGLLDANEIFSVKKGKSLTGKFKFESVDHGIYGKVIDDKGKIKKNWFWDV